MYENCIIDVLTIDLEQFLIILKTFNIFMNIWEIKFATDKTDNLYPNQKTFPIIENNNPCMD
jgi:hypothetical protein